MLMIMIIPDIQNQKRIRKHDTAATLLTSSIFRPNICKLNSITQPLSPNIISNPAIAATLIKFSLLLIVRLS
jgi:hypothetical protein